MADEDKLDRYTAMNAFYQLSEELPEVAAYASVPGIPYDQHGFDNWTAGLLRTAIEIYDGAAKTTADNLRERCIW